MGVRIRNFLYFYLIEVIPHVCSMKVKILDSVTYNLTEYFKIVLAISIKVLYLKTKLCSNYSSQSASTLNLD